MEKDKLTFREALIIVLNLAENICLSKEDKLACRTISAWIEHGRLPEDK